MRLNLMYNNLAEGCTNILYNVDYVSYLFHNILLLHGICVFSVGTNPQTFHAAQMIRGDYPLSIGEKQTSTVVEKGCKIGGHKILFYL